MMAADEGFDYPELFAGHGGDAAADDDKLVMDIDSFLGVLDEDRDASESSPEDSSLKNVSPRESRIRDNFRVQNGDFVLDSEHESRGLQSQTCSSPGACAGGGYRDSFSVVESDEICDSERTGVSKHETPAYSVNTGFPQANSNNIADCGDNLNLSLWNGEDKSQIKHVGDDVESKYASHSSIIENDDVNFEDYSTFLNEIIGVSGQQENDSCTSFEMSFVDAERSMHAATSADPTVCQGSYVPSDFGYCYPSMNCYRHTDGGPVVANAFGRLPNGVYPQFWTNEEMMRNMKIAKMEFFGDTTHVNDGINSSTTGGISLQNSQFMLADRECPLFFPGNVLFEKKASVQSSTYASYISSEGQSLSVKAERDELTMPYQNSSHIDDTNFNVGQDVKQITGTYPSVGCQSYEFFKHEDNATAVTTQRANYYQDINDGTANKFPGYVENLNLESLDESLSIAQASIGNENEFNCVKSEEEGKMNQHKSIDSQLSKGSAERFHVEDDSDVCVIEDISHPAPISRPAELGNSLNMSQSSRCSYTHHHMVGSTRPKARDENYILRVALQVETCPLVF